MKRFFNENNVSENDLLLFNSIIEYDEVMNDEGAFFSGYPFIEINQKNLIVRAVLISSKGINLFVEDKNEEKIYKRHFVSLLMKTDSLSEVYNEKSNELFHTYIISIKSNIFIEEYRNFPNVLSNNDIRELVALIQNIFQITVEDDRKIDKPNSLGSKILERNRKIANLDETQFSAIYNNLDKNTRIRGLAGSGKTILLVKKLAYMHFRYKDKNIAYVFFSKSLKQFIEKLFYDFYKEFDPYGEPDFSKIDIIHSWGSTSMEGFYSKICKLTGISFLTFGLSGGFDNACQIANEQLNENIDLFDFVLIDEAQDFRLNFFKLARKTLKRNGKMIYAYDELQTLNEPDSLMPTPQEIFLNEDCIDINLEQCYRTPMEIIVSAHALGLGIYHTNNKNQYELINAIQDMGVWKATGYKIKNGVLGYGEAITMYRDKVVDSNIDNPIEIKIIERDSYDEICDEIVRLVIEEDVIPNDILVIDLDTININSNYINFASIIHRKVVDKQEFEPKINLVTNIVNKDRAYNFRVDNSIPYTTIFRAKGNEANIVFIMNPHKMNVGESYNRNKLFTAMTRAKFKVYIYGNGSRTESLMTELENVKNNNYELSFINPTKKELAEFKNKIYRENKQANNVTKYLELSKELTNGQSKYLIELMLEQTGTTSKEELIKYIGSLDLENEE